MLHPAHTNLYSVFVPPSLVVTAGSTSGTTSPLPSRPALDNTLKVEVTEHPVTDTPSFKTTLVTSILVDKSFIYMLNRALLVTQKATKCLITFTRPPQGADDRLVN